MLIVEQELSYPGSIVNEDLVWHGGNDAIVLDGSSALSGQGHDAVGFVEAFVARFKDEVATGENLLRCINATIDALRGEFEPERYAEGIVPSAAGAFVHEVDDQLEMVSVADCTIVILGHDGSVIRIRDCAIDRFDTEVIELASSIRSSTGMDISEVMQLPEIRSALLANRKLMNKRGGYRVLASNMKPLRSSAVTRIDKRTVERILIHSDGFDRAADGLALGASAIDLESLYHELRASEHADSALNRFPRFKVSDDASAMLLRVG